MPFKKWKENQNRINPRDRKRKIFATVGLSLILLVSRARCSSSQSLSPDFYNKTIYQRVISEPDFN